MPDCHPSDCENSQIDHVGADIAMTGVPLHERVLDRLADVLLDTDEILAMLTGEDAIEGRWVELHVQRAFDEIDVAMRGMSD